MFNFERLDAWRESVCFAEKVYGILRAFPPEERYGLSGQMRRAVISISSNIAEGCSRSSTSDYARFVEIASGSLFEVVSQAAVAIRLGYLTEEDSISIYRDAERIGKMLSGLRKSLRDKLS